MRITTVEISPPLKKEEGFLYLCITDKNGNKIERGAGIMLNVGPRRINKNIKQLIRSMEGAVNTSSVRGDFKKFILDGRKCAEKDA